MDQGKLNSLAGVEAKIAANGITGTLAMVAQNLNAGNITKLFAKYGGTTATVNASSADTAKLAEVADGVAKIAADGITGTLALSTTNLNENQIGALLGAKTADAATVNVNAQTMTDAELSAVSTGIGKVDAISNLTVTSTQTATEIGNLLGKAADAAVVATTMSIAQLAAVATNIANVTANGAGGITGAFSLNGSDFNSTQIAALLGSKTAIESATVTVDATSMDADERAAVGGNLRKVDNLTIDSTHGVQAAAADADNASLVVTGTSAAADLLTLTGTAEADFDTLSDITTNNASVVYVGGAGADTVIFKAASSSVLAQATVGDSGTYTATSSGTNTHSTAGFDVVNNFGVGDVIKLNSNYSGAANAANGLVATAVTGTTLDSGTFVLADNSVHLIRGTYDVGTTNTFVGAADGVDALLIYDADAADTQAYEAVVIVGGGTLTAMGGNAGLITFS